MHTRSRQIDERDGVATERMRPRWIGVPEASAYTSLGRSTLYSLMAERRLAYATIGRRRVISVESLDALIEAEMVPAG